MSGRKNLKTLLVMSVFLLAIVLSTNVYAGLITVDANGTGDYPTIQAAIDAMEAALGGELYFPPGTYLTDALTLTTAGATYGITVSGAGAASALKANAAIDIFTLDHGGNFRMDTIQAALLNYHLKNVQKYLDDRLNTALYYLEKMKNLPIVLPQHEGSGHTYNQFVIQTRNKQEQEALKEFLNIKSIPTMIYYPMSLDEQKCYN